MDSSPWLDWIEKIYVTVTEKSGEKRNRMVCTEQKIGLWMTDFVDGL